MYASQSEASTRIVLTRAEAIALREHASTDETRQSINAVMFAVNGKVAAVATDGHRLVAYEAPSEPPLRDATALVARADMSRAIQACAASKKHSGLAAYIVFSFGSGAEAHGIGCTIVRATSEQDATEGRIELSMLFSSVDAQFPPYEQVMPPAGPRVARPRPDHVPPGAEWHPALSWAACNTEYLAALDYVAKAAGAKGMRIEPGAEELDPVRFWCLTLGGEGRWTAVIMPMCV